MSKTQKTALAIYIVMTLMYNVLFFAIPFPKSGAAWLTYVFTLVSFGVSFISLRLTLDGNKNLESKFYGFPIYRIAVIYLSIQLVLGFTICLLGYSFEFPLWLATVINIIVLGIALIGMIADRRISEYIDDNVIKKKNDLNAIKELILAAAEIESIIPEGTTRERMDKLTEILRYSDPVSSEKTMELDNELLIEMQKLSTMLEEKESGIEEQIDYISRKLKARNLRCRAEK